jgi:hypothetical protein
MMTGWRMVKVCIGDWPVAEFECKYDLTYSDMAGWHLLAVVITDLDDKPLRIERDGSVKLDGNTKLHAHLARSIASAALCEFEAHRSDILNDLGLLQAA